MDITVFPRKLNGAVQAIPSKSQAHRLLICAALSENETRLVCPETNQDIEATVSCLQALGASITRTKDGYHVIPIIQAPAQALLPCQESGSTLRFMLPVVGALGVDGVFELKGRLPSRPLSPLWEEMERMGCTISRPSENTIRCNGKLRPGDYYIDGGISSQFITGLLLALPLLSENSRICITGQLESVPYLHITQNAMSLFGVNTENYSIQKQSCYMTPHEVTVEGDWSNAAFFITARALGNNISISNLNPHSPQGDRIIEKLLSRLNENCIISAADVPDLVPILSVAAAYHHGCTFTDIGRLRLKESDRVEAVIQMLNSLGIHSEATETTLTVYPGKFHGGSISSYNDHRIAMASAIAATVADSPVTILDAHCVAKSYPGFWDEYTRLGGHYEQYIR